MSGKALKLDTPLPTPTGWTTMGEVAVGDQLIGADGKPTRVVAATEVMVGRPCFEVEFSDGTVIVADAEHQWLTDTRASRKSAQAAAVGYNRYKNQRTFAAVRTTREIAETLRCPTIDRRLNHSVANAAPLQAPDRDLLVPPYTLGAWLGDGTTASAQITSADPEVIVRIEADGFVAHQSTAAKYRYQLRLPEDELVAARGCVVCGASFVPHTSQVRTCGRILRRTRTFHVGPSTRAHLHSLRRTVVRTEAVPGMPQRGGHITGATPHDRRTWQQAHSERVSACIGIAAESIVGRIA